jgi:hypothetical protein
MPGTGKSPEELYARAVSLAGTPGQAYVEGRGVSMAVAEPAGVRFDNDFGGRPAVVVALRDETDELTSIHGRYLHTMRGQNKMLTIGPGNGVIKVLDGSRAEPLVIVEGLFDALSLAMCGWASIAMIGRWASWLPHVCRGRTVWIAFDTGRPGERDAIRYGELLQDADVRRLPPPPKCKDWNTALVKRGPVAVKRWISDQIATDATLPI